MTLVYNQNKKLNDLELNSSGVHAVVWMLKILNFLPMFCLCILSDVETMMNVTRLSCDKLKSQCTDDNTSIRQAVKQVY